MQQAAAQRSVEHFNVNDKGCDAELTHKIHFVKLVLYALVIFSAQREAPFISPAQREAAHTPNHPQQG